MKTVFIRKQAYIDATQIANWYAVEAPHVLDEFDGALDEAFTALETDLQQNTTWSPEDRSAITQKREASVACGGAS